MSTEKRSSLKAAGETLHEAAVENPGTIGVVGRYHAPIRAAFLEIRAELSSDTTEKCYLQLAGYAVNATIGPEGLCRILLVFGVLPRPARKTPSAAQLERARAVEHSMTATEK